MYVQHCKTFNKMYHDESTALEWSATQWTYLYRIDIGNWSGCQQIGPITAWYLPNMNMNHIYIYFMFILGRYQAVIGPICWHPDQLLISSRHEPHIYILWPRWLSWMETRRSRVQPPPRSATFFRGDWSWNIFYGHFLPSADSRRAVVSFWRKNVHNTG